MSLIYNVRICWIIWKKILWFIHDSQEKDSSIDCIDFIFHVQMDIVCQNYVAQERSKHISNAEVVAIELSSDGIWLATAQMRDDPDFYSDTQLKFWLFDRKSQT